MHSDQKMIIFRDDDIQNNVGRGLKQAVSIISSAEN